MSVTSKLDEFNAKYAGELSDGEKIVAHCEPNVLLTNERLIELNWSGKKVLHSFPLHKIASLSRKSSKLTPSLIVQFTYGGSEEVFAGLSPDTWHLFNEIFKNVWSAKNEGKHLATPVSDREKYGAIAAKGFFGTKQITIYSKGFVQVSSGLGISKGEVENLRGIFGETDITKKTGLGRAAAAVITSGMNLALAPNQRGNLYLTITTDRKTHSLMWDRPDAQSLKSLNELVSAGKAAIASAKAAETSDTPKVVNDDSETIESKLQQLAVMREKGLLDEEEFKASKAKLLGL